MSLANQHTQHTHNLLYPVVLHDLLEWSSVDTVLQYSMQHELFLQLLDKCCVCCLQPRWLSTILPHMSFWYTTNLVRKKSFVSTTQSLVTCHNNKEESIHSTQQYLMISVSCFVTAYCIWYVDNLSLALFGIDDILLTYVLTCYEFCFPSSCLTEAILHVLVAFPFILLRIKLRTNDACLKTHPNHCCFLFQHASSVIYSVQCFITLILST